jgi:pimeloyl-ACP methyl ester carboxylesterase
LDAARTLDRALMTTSLIGGYGRPGRRGASLAPAALASRILQRGLPGLDSLVVALSAGCQVAAHLALQAPDRVTGLVLIGPTTDPRAATWPRLMRRWMQTARSEPIHQVPVLLQQYRRTGPTSMVRAMNQARMDDLHAVLSQVTCPVLVIRGANDTISPEDWNRSLTRQHEVSGNGASMRHNVTLSAGAHMVPYTHPEEVARHVSHFVNPPPLPT